jgi:hypothetical protein
MAWVAVTRAEIDEATLALESIDSGFEDSDYINIPNDPLYFDQRLASTYRYVV